MTEVSIAFSGLNCSPGTDLKGGKLSVPMLHGELEGLGDARDVGRSRNS